MIKTKCTLQTINKKDKNDDVEFTIESGREPFSVIVSIGYRSCEIRVEELERAIKKIRYEEIDDIDDLPFYEVFDEDGED